MPRATINYALAATLLAQGMDLPEVAPQVGAKTPESLRVGLNRKGVTVTAAKVLQNATGSKSTVILKLASQASEILRKDAGEILQAHVSKFKEIPAKANLSHIQRVGQALEPLIRSAKIVHDWGNQEATGLVMSGLLTDETPQESIDVGGTPQRVVGGPDQTVNNLSDNSTSDGQLPNAS